MTENQKTVLILFQGEINPSHYPGNIALYQPEVRQLVTVFGRLKLPNGEYIKYASIRNHIGRTKTDQNGEFPWMLTSDIQ